MVGMERKLRMGMVGGGQGAFIGAVHRIAARLDGEIELVCGAFSSTPEKSKASAHDLGIAAHRSYGTYREMFEREAALPADERVELISIVTPNNSHFDIAGAALRAGFHVMCEKPVTLTLQQALQLKEVSETAGKLICVAYTYTGYPMIKEAREIVASGKLGKLRKVIVDYTQGWLTHLDAHNKQARWRGDPAQAGIGGCMGDIGTHAANLAEYVTGECIESVSAELSTFVEGRVLDDDGMVFARMSGGLKGLLHASQVAAGEENNLTLRVYGEHGGLEWRQQEPNSLWLKWLSAPMQVLRTGSKLSALAQANTRTPLGHPEGYLEAFANIYRSFTRAIRRCQSGETADLIADDYPGIDEGIRSMALLEAIVASSSSERKWHLVKVK